MNNQWFEITIPAKAIPWTSPRIGRNRSYSTHTSWRKNVTTLLLCMFRRDPLEGAVEVEVSFHFLPPKGVSKKNRAKMLAGEIKHAKRPDASNLEKLAIDCGNKVLWEDDGQIFRLVALKLYDTTEKMVYRFREVS